jgi:hypothetical protein
VLVWGLIKNKAFHWLPTYTTASCKPTYWKTNIKNHLKRNTNILLNVLCWTTFLGAKVWESLDCFKFFPVIFYRKRVFIQSNISPLDVQSPVHFILHFYSIKLRTIEFGLWGKIKEGWNLRSYSLYIHSWDWRMRKRRKNDL